MHHGDGDLVCSFFSTYRPNTDIGCGLELLQQRGYLLAEDGLCDDMDTPTDH